MRIGVTGGSGFIGSHVVDALVEAGHEVSVIDRLPPRRFDVEHRDVDLMDGEAMKGAVASLDVLFHLAAYADVNDVARDPAGAVDTNIGGTLRALEAARANSVERFILASTVWVYSSVVLPQQGASVDESALISMDAGRHLYTSTKLASELLVQDYLHMHGLPFTILRYGIPYGPRMRPSLVLPLFVHRALAGEALTITGDGSQQRKFVYVTDLARAHVVALQPQAENRTFNLDGNEEVTILRIAQTVLRLTASEVPLQFLPARIGDYRGADVSSAAAKRLLGWEPLVSFDDGARETVQWLMAEASLPVRR
ncbi:MAG TPA: NAD-dependent epimerase/dehydratase family protein [Dehalococcoidia bacterium]|nr:NAD-dependent epimerase/dehydratase family protein [Dehalococcoidia bacterium]